MSSLALEFPRRTLRNFMHRVEVPRDIEAVTHIDAAAECDPLEAGIAHKQAAAIWRAVEDLYRTGYYPAVMFCLRRQGRIVFNRAIGHVRGNAPGEDADTPKVPVSTLTPSCIFSASKAITAMLLHRLEEKGEINLLNPICLYIPELG